MMRKSESGQALVMVLLSLAVVLTLVLFILSRSITDVAVSSGQAESVRAFSAAEAGIEKALVIGTGSTSTSIGDASYSSTVSDFAKASYDFNYPAPLLSGDTMTTWFVAHDSDGNMICDSNLGYPCFTGNILRICWGNAGTSADTTTTPALELSVYYESTPGDIATVKIARAAFDPNSGRTTSNSFAAPDGGICQIEGTNFAFQKNITFSSLGIPSDSYQVQNGLIFARVRLFYNTDVAHAVGTSVNGSSSTLPSQGINVVSTGTAGQGTAQSNRRVSVFQGWPEFTFGGNSLFSASAITK